jgi:hypothetical protein
MPPSTKVELTTKTGIRNIPNNTYSYRRTVKNFDKTILLGFIGRLISKFVSCEK